MCSSAASFTKGCRLLRVDLQPFVKRNIRTRKFMFMSMSECLPIVKLIPDTLVSICMYTVMTVPVYSLDRYVWTDRSRPRKSSTQWLCYRLYRSQRKTRAKSQCQGRWIYFISRHLNWEELLLYLQHQCQHVSVLASASTCKMFR